MSPFRQAQKHDCYDVIIIGAGMIGAMVLRELSRFSLKIAVIDKESQAGLGASRSSLSYIHRNHINPPGTLRARLCHNSQLSYQKLSKELSLDYDELDEINIAFDKEQEYLVRKRMEWAIKNGETSFRVISNKEVAKLEPHLNQNFSFATFSEDHGLIYPPEWAFALIENAKDNGADIFFNTEVIKLNQIEDESWIVSTDKGQFKARYIINAAGLYADYIAHMAGDKEVKQFMTRGTFAIFDSAIASIMKHIIYVGGVTPEWSQSISPTVHGNLILGMGHFKIPESPTDTKVTKEELDIILRMGKEMIPDLPLNDLITSFAGIKITNNLASDGDFFVGSSGVSPTFIHALICSPGITAAPGIANEILKLLSNANLDLKEKPFFKNTREPIFSFNSATDEQISAKIKENPQYGHLICRCEKVSEGEIREAIRRGSSTIEGVKHLTRAGMGRCQGGFCSPLILKILSEELGISATEITRKGKGSNEIAAFDSKEAYHDKH